MSDVPEPPAPVDELVRRGRAARLGWLVLGLTLVAIGLVGIVVPLLPTTDFMILAIPCFARSSPRLERWILEHPRFGPSVRAWRQQRAVPLRAKVAAWLGISIGYAAFLLAVRPNPLVAALVAAALSGCAWWLWRRPVPDTSKTAADAKLN